MDVSGFNVVVATPAWSLNGPNVFAANLVGGLRAAGVRAHILLTRPDWSDGKPMSWPPGVPLRTLPVGRYASLRSRWRAMSRYLEEMTPCILSAQLRLLALLYQLAIIGSRRHRRHRPQ